MKIKYTFFEQFIFRTPLFPRNDTRDLKTLIQDKIFREALYLGSYDLFQEMNLLDENHKKITGALLKYYNRSHTRCTPFGLFAGCSIGDFSKKSNICLESIDNYTRHTRLDMNYLCAVVSHIEKQKDIRLKLLYYPNDSIYKFGNKYRYVEYFYKQTKRIHILNNVEGSVYLEQIFDLAKKGIKIFDLANSLVCDDITYEEAENFIFDLIDAQLLKSELDISVTGDDQLSVLLHRLQKIGDSYFLDHLSAIGKTLSKIDQLPLGESIKLYKDIILQIKELGIPYEPKYLFQTDLFKPTCHATLDAALVSELDLLLGFYNKIKITTQESDLQKFITAFSERYEEQEIPLAEVLDPETGLGYPVQNSNSGEIDELIHDIFYEKKKYSRQDFLFRFSSFDKILLKKYIEARVNNNTIIELCDNDLEGMEEDWSEIPDTITILCNIIQTSAGIKFFIKNIGGPSGAYLLGRFAYLNPKLYQHTKRVADKEQEINKDAIMAEIVHLPESRIGNIAFRPILREYEIHYLAQSSVDLFHQIDINDLLISCQNNQIILKSIKHKKQIIPCLTNAHNFGFNAMPIYHFLCDLQNQGKHSSLSFNWNPFFRQFPFLPRIEYKGHIIAPQSWNLSTDEICKYKDLPDCELMDYVQEWRDRYNIPGEVIYPEGDNELYVRLDDILNVRTFISIIKKLKEFVLIENVFKNDMALIQDAQGGLYNNEFIFSLYKKIS